MDHVAIIKKSWGLLPKILSGEKSIESRWYMRRYTPWGKISNGDTIYFKNSGELVIIKATVQGIKKFERLTPKKVRDILYEYGERDGITEKDIPKYYELFKNKKYCLLISLTKPEKVHPFAINKKGFGAMAAWLTIPHIAQVQKR